MPPSELTPNYRADNNRGAQSCAAVCSRRKSGCRIAGCHAPFCRPRIILRARCHSTLPPPCPDYRKLSTIIPPAPRVYRSNHSIRVSRDRLRRRSTFDIRHGERDEISREGMLLEKEFEQGRVKRILLSFRFRPTRFGIVTSSSWDF